MIAVPLPPRHRRVAGFWMSDPVTLAYEVEDANGDRTTLLIEFESPEQATLRCAETIRSVIDTVRAEGLVHPRRAAYVGFVADLIADWVLEAARPWWFRPPEAHTAS
jgi:hypothetical protein